jgi:hypothetical protein
MVTPEDAILQHKLKAQIVSEIKRVVKSILRDTPKSEPNTPECLSAADPNEETSIAFHLESKENQILRKPPIPSNCVLGFLFPLKTFYVLQDNNTLPESVQGMRVKYELDSNRLLVQVVASPAHDASANAWNGRFAVWSMNGGAGPSTLMQCGQGRIFSVLG